MFEYEYKTLQVIEPLWSVLKCQHGPLTSNRKIAPRTGYNVLKPHSFVFKLNKTGIKPNLTKIMINGDLDSNTFLCRQQFVKCLRIEKLMLESL